MEKTARRYIFTGLRNARDMGGHPARGGVTRFGVFIRSDLPRGITGEDRRALRDLGLTTVVDLREAEEAGQLPDELRDEPWLTYRSVPVLGVKAAAVRDRPGGVSAFDRQFSWGEEYIRMLQGNHPWVKQVLELLAASEGVVLFHCFTGKDRTGLLAALLLGLCGVPREDIEADYAVSQIYLGDVYRWMREMIPDFRDRELSSPFFSTAPENIRLVLDELEREYGGAEGFAAACGTDPGAVEAIRERLIKRA